MAADLTGIENVGEFFSQHYLDELLVADLKDLRADWSQAAGKSPPERLRSVSRDFTRALGEAASISRPERLYELSHPLQIQLAEALGYRYEPALLALDEGRGLPVLHQVTRQGEPYLLVVEGRFHHEGEDGALQLELLEAQMGDDPPLTRPRASLSELMLEVFAGEAPPRWILLISGSDLILAERPKWGRGQYLRFDLSELLGRKDTTALAITSALTCREALVPDEGAPVHDTLDENSHKHAHGVSGDLKYAARKAVELLGNEYVYYQRTTGKKALYAEQAAAELTSECLTYLYRLLFLFYAEARAAELRSLPMDAEEYRLGYSLEALRDLELVPLSTPEAQDGFYIYESLERLFSLVDGGFHPEWTRQQLPGMEYDASSETYLERGFRVQGLHSPLFDSKQTPRLSSVKFRNQVMQEVIRLLSLSSTGRAKRGSRAYGMGRISYAQLGINQLGSVYEGLLSYTGFFSKERLHEVHKAGEEPKLTDQAFFVPESEITRYSEDERLFTNEENEKRPRIYEPGTFIFRLSGRNRETSASYYTPEVLTRCLIKYSLKELLQGKTADHILELTVCEPALGSGAFVVEAIDQLADAYLERKQAELGEHIPPERYGLEKQKVKDFIATRNCYGVDLNPMAARLAEVSLWLATMHEGQAAPWFGARLGTGNSLVGARLAVWDVSDLETDEALVKTLNKKLKTHAERSDMEQALEELLAVAEPSATDVVAAVREVLSNAAHPKADRDAEGDSDEDAESLQSPTDSRMELVKALKKAIGAFKVPRYQRKPPIELSLRDILEGRHTATSVYHFLLPDPGMSSFDKDKAVKELVPEAVKTLAAWRKDLSSPFSQSDARRLVALSRRVDDVLQVALEERRALLAVCESPTQVWGQRQQAPPPGGWRSIKRRVEATRIVRAEGRAYACLKRVMDLWAAQWAWPLEHAEALPSRSEWWSQVESILGIDGDSLESLLRQLEFEPTADSLEAPLVHTEHGGLTPLAQVTAQLAPFHWQLEFPEVSAVGGFDLVVGNPPWINLHWNEQGILSDMEARLKLDSVSAPQTALRRPGILEKEPGRVPQYLRDFVRVSGAVAVLSSPANYPALRGVRTNLYKCFILQAARLTSPGATIGLLVEEGIFEDLSGGAVRTFLFPRLSWCLRFQNQQKFFEIDNSKRFQILVFGSPKDQLRFSCIANLFHPLTADESIDHDGKGDVPGIKNARGFDLRGHAERVVSIDLEGLKLFARVFHHQGELEAVRLPVIHTRQALNGLRVLAVARHRAVDLLSAGTAFPTTMWNATNAVEDGTLRQQTVWPDDWSNLMVSGPHFYVAEPFTKSPKAVCTSPKHYDTVDYTSIGPEYIPRTNHVRACPVREYEARAQQYQGRPVHSYFRHVHREYVKNYTDRSFVPAIIPPGPGHTNSVVSICFAKAFELLACSGMWSSIIVDNWVRLRGTEHINRREIEQLPIPVFTGALSMNLAARALRLNALYNPYGTLWDEEWSRLGERLRWSSADPRLSRWPSSSTRWSADVALRTPYARRMALVEIDALVALELGLSCEELCAVYNTGFDVLAQNENETWYDARGLIVFTVNKRLPGVGLKRAAFERWQAALAAGEAVPPDFATFDLQPPFDRCDREEDMRRAYFFFAEQLGIDIPENRGDA